MQRWGKAQLFHVRGNNEKTNFPVHHIVNEYTEFTISEDQAAGILATEDNPFFVEGHRYLGSKVVPKMGSTGAFFAYQAGGNRQNLLAREVAGAQHVVWNTGTHTATPVLVFAKGSPGSMAPSGNVLHHTQLGRYVMDAVLNR